MSYDFELYTARKFGLPTPPVPSVGNISVDGPDKLEEEDIPVSYLPVIGMKRWLNRIHIEGPIDQSDRASLSSWLRTVVVEAKGVLVDLQSETYETIKKSGTIVAGNEANSEMGAMSFYFEDGEGFYRDGFEEMLKTIAETFPAALPRRYGHYEPLQGKLKEGQYDAIVSAFQKETDHFLMKPAAPFGHIYMSVPCKKYFENMHSMHFMRRHFLLGNVSFELQQKLFENPAHLSDLLQLFEALCVQLDVVYAEILKADEPPEVWFWRGLPDRKTVHSLCIGPAYCEVWPDAAKTGYPVGEYHRVFSIDRFDNTPKQPPSELRAPKESGIDMNSTNAPNYAAVFPFNFKFDRDRFVW